MNTTTKLTLAVLIALAPATAFAAPSVGDALGTSVAEIATNLQDAGYEVREIERDDSDFEVEIIVDGQLYELEISPRTGMITEVELEDDDDMDDRSESAN